MNVLESREGRPLRLRPWVLMVGAAVIVTVVAVVLISLLTTPKPDAELRNLVMGLTPRTEVQGPWRQRPIFWAGVLALVLVGINLYLW